MMDREKAISTGVAAYCYWGTWEGAFAAYEAELSSQGYVIVPREPTEAMYWAASNEHETWTDPTDGAALTAVYRAMIDAALKEQGNK